ncbi:EpsG family protein [Parabacteroides sp. AF18-52]|uniref:EpsG family protein n=1 Tax=Parabacteroides sp. AF18-52 TaxID=2292242 RepID=UPI000F00368A|nr:EpsG family protein [Parabacteroides sp. AF18-52]
MNIIIIIIFFILFLSWSFIKNNHNKTTIFLFIIAISFLTSIRNDSVPDTKNYREYYNALEGIESFIFYTFELGFQCYSYILKIILKGNDKLYFFCITFMNSILIFDALKRIQQLIKSNTNSAINPLLYGLVFLFSYYGLFYNAITIRAGIAMALYIQAFSFLCKDDLATSDKIKIFIICFLAYFFHKSSVIFWMILFLAHFMPRLSKRTYLLIILFSCLIFFSRVNILVLNVFNSFFEKIINILSNSNLDTISLYRETITEEETKLSFKFMFQLFSGFLFLSVRFISMPKMYFYFLNIYYIGLVLGAFLAPITMMYRVLDYFLILTFILYMFWVQSTKLPFRLVFIISSGAILYQLILFYRVIIP